MDEKLPYSGFAITGFVLGIISVFAFTRFVLGITNMFTVPVLIIIVITLLGIIPALGIIFSLIGISKTGKKKKRGKVLAIIGLVLSTIIFIYSIYVIPRILFASSG